MFGDRGHAKCKMGPKLSLEGVLLGLKSPCLSLRGVPWDVLGLQCHPSDCRLGWNGSYGSMGPVGHVRHLDLVMGAMPSAQWAPNSRFRVSFLA